MYDQKKIEIKNVSEMTNKLVKLQEQIRLCTKENDKEKHQIVNLTDGYQNEKNDTENQIQRPHFEKRNYQNNGN